MSRMQYEERNSNDLHVRSANYFTGYNNAIKLLDYQSQLSQPSTVTIVKYRDVINFDRTMVRGGSHRCVMCGRFSNQQCIIPVQNKDVCKSCDSSFWFHQSLKIVIKFCKGCKNFLSITEFRDKPDASKCTKCRARGRQNYSVRQSEKINKVNLNIENENMNHDILFNSDGSLTDNSESADSPDSPFDTLTSPNNYPILYKYNYDKFSKINLDGLLNSKSLNNALSAEIDDRNYSNNNNDKSNYNGSSSSKSNDINIDYSNNNSQTNNIEFQLRNDLCDSIQVELPYVSSNVNNTILVSENEMSFNTYNVNNINSNKCHTKSYNSNSIENNEDFQFKVPIGRGVKRTQQTIPIITVKNASRKSSSLKPVLESTVPIQKEIVFSTPGILSRKKNI